MDTMKRNIQSQRPDALLTNGFTEKEGKNKWQEARLSYHSQKYGLAHM